MRYLLLAITGLSAIYIVSSQNLKQAKYDTYLLAQSLKSAITSPHSTWLAVKQLNDLPQLEVYRDANNHIPSPQVIFYGDSITQRWKTGFLESHHYLDRGIDGQNTNQLLLRFHQDVIELKPKKVVILGGVNDIVELKGYIPIEATENNIRVMVEISKSHHIEPILCTLLPIFHYPGRNRSAEVQTLNYWIRGYAREQNLQVIDYYKAMNVDLTNDGLHPSTAGYKVMESEVKKMISPESVSISSLQHPSDN